MSVFCLLWKTIFLGENFCLLTVNGFKVNFALDRVTLGQLGRRAQSRAAIME